MKLILLGNAGSGKSTLSKKIIAGGATARLSLDEVAFQEGTERRPVADSITEVMRFIREHDSWIIEGCYADIIEGVLQACDELIFLNPGVETCVAHCRSRPWEPEKFSSSQEQDEHLNHLIEWVLLYENRSDEYGLRRHRALFESFSGKKRELTRVADYEAI